MKKWLLSAILVAFIPDALALPPMKPLDATDHEDRARMTALILRRVAYISVKARPRKNDAYRDPVHDGYGVPISPNRIACLNFIVERAEAITVKGPNGKTSPATVILYDVERRVAILETKVEVTKLGLVVVELSKASEREIDQPVFAITATEEPYLLDGVLTDLGLAPELEGILLSDLKLSRGMPAFDDRARFVGYGRTVEWDTNTLMLVSPETIALARTATGAASRPSPPAKKEADEEEAPSGWIRGKTRAR